MSSSKKKSDPISERARALNDEIAALEAQIQQLDSQLKDKPQPAHPRLRSTAIPHGPTVQRPGDAEGLAAQSPPAAIRRSDTGKADAGKSDPVFEEVDKGRLQSPGEMATPGHFNELGVRKYDLPALIQRLKNYFRGPTTTNPKLVSYLAAGSVQGLRPLRYEKRVARNRFIGLAVLLFLLLLGIILWLVKRH